MDGGAAPAPECWSLLADVSEAQLRKLCRKRGLDFVKLIYPRSLLERGITPAAPSPLRDHDKLFLDTPEENFN